MTAVIGGGLTGCLVALDLAERGHSVVIFEKETGLMQRASLANEGKIHLGYVYSADASFRTAKTLIDDALLFRPLLEKWMAAAEFDAYLTDPFHYIVPENTSISHDRILDHFQRVEAYRCDQENRSSLTYLGLTQKDDTCAATERSAEHGVRIGSHERAVWPIGIARTISARVNSHPFIEVRAQTTVCSIEPAIEKWRIVLAGQHQRQEGPFDTVVNASWADRRNIDRKSGFASHETWFTRFKFGVLLGNAAERFGGHPPLNGTGTSGPYGDSVYYPQDDSLYCSWYPVGMCYTSRNDAPDFRLEIENDAEQLMRDTWAGYAGIDPDYRPLAALNSPLRSRLIGDFIVAKGHTDIVDASSQLHERYTHGPRELAPGYWSIDTGKYSSAPRCAAQCVAAILGDA